MKLLPVLFAALVLAAPAARADTLTPRAFTERVARAALAAMPSAKVAINGELQFVVRYGNGASATSDLGKAYKTYEREPDHLDDIVQAQVTALMEAGGDANGLPKLDRSRIVPIIKDRGWVEVMARRGREQSRRSSSSPSRSTATWSWSTRKTGWERCASCRTATMSAIARGCAKPRSPT